MRRTKLKKNRSREKVINERKKNVNNLLEISEQQRTHRKTHKTKRAVAASPSLC